ncbi:MAG: hypothetical protein O3A53_15655 [Acidobacteria bacterium]|nr:hypothetical protein [Acidobacteriota bacterium]MDA1236222.1 hypothetical protein [Acidobacteriota bacterium]
MPRRQSQPRSFGTTFAIVTLLCAVAYQLFTKGLPAQLSADRIEIAPIYDAAASSGALDLFRGND